MIPVERELQNRFKDTSCSKKLILEFESEILDNESIVSETMSIEESICDSDAIVFGKCSSACFRVQIADVAMDYRGQALAPALEVGSYQLPLGRYVVDSCKLTSNRRYRDIIAYDAIYYSGNRDVSAWYRSLTFPMKLKEFRHGLFGHLGIVEREAALCNDEMIVEETIDPQKLSALDVMESICEANGCFGRMGREGKFEYVYLRTEQDMVYPSNDLYPSDNLYPSDRFVESCTMDFYEKIVYEDYKVETISQLQIRQEENDIGVVVGKEGNSYIIEDNFLLYGKGTVELETIAKNILQKIQFIPYTPSVIDMPGLPYLEAGDSVQVYTDQRVIFSYLLKRKLSGIQALWDTCESFGNPLFPDKVNGLTTDIIQLKGKSNVLERSIEETRSTITDLGAGLQSQITQTAEEIRAEVQRTNDGLSSSIAQTASDITAEVNRATKAEGELSGKLTIEANKIAAEVSRATAKEGELLGKLSVEADRITAEVNRSTKKEGELSGRITVTENNISSKVSKGDVCSTINQSSDAITMKSNRFSLQSDNLTITAKGNITAKNGTITAASITNGDPVKGDSYFTLQSDGTLRVGFISVGKGGLYNAGKLQNVKDIETDANLYANFASIGSGGIYTTGNLTAAGGKSRVVRTDNYAERLLYCYETPAPLFGDVGGGILDEHGECCITVDDVFSETIQTVCYHVFLTQYGAGEIYVAERTPAYFLVRGTPGLEFSWELKAKQRDFEAQRLDTFLVEEPEGGIDYEAEAEEYINQLQEAMKYE